MSAKMLPIDEVLAGMVLAAPLLDAAGGVLLPQGATLSESMLAGLRRREVAELCIEVAEPPLDPEVRQAMRKVAEQRLRHLFRQAGDDPATRTFYQTVLDYRLEQLQ